jgi:plastocyanin
MRKSILLLLAVAAVVVAPARALAANVTITTLGFVPASVTITEGDTVTWTNTDTATHQVVEKKAGLSSPVLSTGQSYSFVFKKAGNFSYQDALDKKLRGTVVVNAAAKPAPKAAPAARASLTLAASSLLVVYGGGVTLSGTASSKQAGEKVTVLAQEYGKPSFTGLATVTTGSGGSWSYVAKPKIRTGYESQWNRATSAIATVGVRPLVSFRVITGHRFSTKVVAARSFAGRYVQLQRRSSLGQWVTVKRVQLNGSSAAIFRASLPHGTSSLRIAMSVNQAGAGYLAGMSRTIVYSRA